MLRRRKTTSLAARGGFEHFQRVRLRGLKAKPELNGLEGVVIEWVEDEIRWKVRLDDGTGKEIKPANLELAPEGCAVSADVREGFISEPLPEPTAPSPAFKVIPEPAHQPPSVTPSVAPTSVDRDWQEERSDRTQIAVAPGTRVRVRDLKGAVDLNQKEGVVLDRDLSDNDGRWRVALDEGSSKSIRETNLLALAVPSSSKLAGKADSSVFAVGCRVRVIGLQARPELNKQEGIIDDWDDGEARWRVCLESGPQLLLRQINLQPVTAEVRPEPFNGHKIVPGARVRVCSLHTATHLNGEEGTALLWNEDGERWKVRLDDGSGKMLQATNLLMLSMPLPDSQPVRDMPDEHETKLAIGVRIKVQGLQVRDELNGQEGEVVGWDEMESRWQVELADGTRVLLKCDNLVPASSINSICPIS